MSRDGHIAEEEFFSAEQNARLVMNAERYYRAMFHGRDESRNLRDTHMFETLNELAAHLDSGRAKVVMWAHNSHLGNARATETSERGVRPGMRDSYEELFHATGIPRFWLNLRERNDATKLLRQPRLQRAIGVIYRPETERWSHYFHARLPEQFDTIIHLDETRALEPLERTSEWDAGELPETYPEGV
jgi:erythromycin esterase-like protein